MTRTKPNLNATKPSVMRFQMLSETNLPAGLGGSNPPVRTDVCQHADPAVVSESSPAIDLMPAAKSKKAGPLPANVLYHANLRAAVSEEVNDTPKARVHRVEWNKIMNEDPVEINPSIGSGYKVMTVEEWSSRWKRNDDLPACLRCGGTHTKEHHFTQTWWVYSHRLDLQTKLWVCILAPATLLHPCAGAGRKRSGKASCFAWTVMRFHGAAMWTPTS